MDSPALTPNDMYQYDENGNLKIRKFDITDSIDEDEEELTESISIPPTHMNSTNVFEDL